MQYREHPVPPELRRHVRCVWRIVDRRPGPGPQTIYPDGCCELVVHLGTPPRELHIGGNWQPQARTLFAAQWLSAVRLTAKGPMDCIGVRLTPAASAMIVGPRLARLRDRVVDLEKLDRGFARALRSAAREFARGEPDGLWSLLARRGLESPIDTTLERALSLLEGSSGKARIADVARAAGGSLRGFQLRFRRLVGLAPKEFARVLRLQATLRALDADADLAQVALDGGFADQAHATRELKRFSGFTPARLRAALHSDRGADATIRLAAAFVRGGS